MRVRVCRVFFGFSFIALSMYVYRVFLLIFSSFSLCLRVDLVDFSKAEEQRNSRRHRLVGRNGLLLTLLANFVPFCCVLFFFSFFFLFFFPGFPSTVSAAFYRFVVRYFLFVFGVFFFLLFSFYFYQPLQMLVSFLGTSVVWRFHIVLLGFT